MCVRVEMGKNVRVTVMCISVGVGGMAPFLAVSASAQSLPDAMVIFYVNSPEIQAARADVKIVSEFATQAGAGGQMRVEGKLSLQALTRINMSTDTANFPNYPAFVALNAVQPLYTGGPVTNSTEAPETRITRQGAILTSTEADRDRCGDSLCRRLEARSKLAQSRHDETLLATPCSPRSAS